MAPSFPGRFKVHHSRHYANHVQQGNCVIGPLTSRIDRQMDTPYPLPQSHLL